MALNIKKQRVCNLAREAAERFNTTQVEVIEKALQKLLHSEEQRRKERYERTMAAVDAIHASTTDEVATVEAGLKFGVPGVSWTVVKNLSLFEHVR